MRPIGYRQGKWYNYNMEKEALILYHVVSRTMDGTRIFLDAEDCFRFVFQMHAANNGTPCLNLYRKDIPQAAKMLLRGEAIPTDFVKIQHAPLANIFSFCLASDHFHFILNSNKENGISKFLNKLNLGFAKYFNLRHKKRGRLFKKPFKITPIFGNSQLHSLVSYVNIKSCLDVYKPGWEETGLGDADMAANFLNNYQFSSFPDLFLNRNSKITAPRDLIEKIGINLNNKEKYLNLLGENLNEIYN